MTMTDSEIENVARVCHEANRAYCVSIGDVSQPSWDLCEHWQRQSAVAGVRKMLEDPTTTPEQLHQAWCDHKTKDGWVYGETKSGAYKIHPCLVPYDRLPLEQKRKDELFRAVVCTLTPWTVLFAKATADLSKKKDDDYVKRLQKNLLDAFLGNTKPEVTEMFDIKVTVGTLSRLRMLSDWQLRSMGIDVEGLTATCLEFEEKLKCK